MLFLCLQVRNTKWMRWNLLHFGRIFFDIRRREDSCENYMKLNLLCYYAEQNDGCALTACTAAERQNKDYWWKRRLKCAWSGGFFFCQIWYNMHGILHHRKASRAAQFYAFQSLGALWEIWEFRGKITCMPLLIWKWTELSLNIVKNPVFSALCVLQKTAVWYTSI